MSLRSIRATTRSRKPRSILQWDQVAGQFLQRGPTSRRDRARKPMGINRPSLARKLLNISAQSLQE